MIELKNINKTIKNNKVLSDINATFEEGRIYLIEGHNGCGKTMLLRIICNLISADTGSITKDKDYTYGAIIENPSFVEADSAMCNLRYLANINKTIDNQQIEEWLKKLNLYDVKDKKVKTFSLGMKQRLGICQAMMENQDVLLLDEPFNALDESSLKLVMDIINKAKKEGKMIIIAAHNISFKDMLDVDKVIKMDNGRLLNK